MRSLKCLTEKNQLHQLKLNADEQVTNVNHPFDASCLQRLIYISEFNNMNETIRFDSYNPQKNSIKCQAERIILLDNVLSTNLIQQSHGFVYRKENFHLNLFIFAIVLLSTLCLVYQAFKVDLTDRN